MSPKTIASSEHYAAVFFEECQSEYPVVDAFEKACGFAIDRVKLELAAGVLACPVKEHPPNWQHGRVLYAWTRDYLSTRSEPILLLDIGTAKGFSALCLQWALEDSTCPGAVVSVDVLDPLGTETRNSVIECDGPKTLAQFLEPWPAAKRIEFIKSDGIGWLKKHPVRVNLAFIDGKHSGAVVSYEAELIAKWQLAGDRVLFDDVQIPGVAMAVETSRLFYDISFLTLGPGRVYALGVRR